MVRDKFSRVEVDKCVYTKVVNNQYVIISLYVDDILIFGTSIVSSTKYFLSSSFDKKDQGEEKMILGVKIIRVVDGSMLSQKHYTEGFLRKFKFFYVTYVRTAYDGNTPLKKIMVIQLFSLNMFRLLEV